jgi:hypothetical protein
MDGPTQIRPPADFIGVAGRCGSEEEKAYVKQAVFLLRYRIKFLAGQTLPAPELLPDPSPSDAP